MAEELVFDQQKFKDNNTLSTGQNLLEMKGNEILQHLKGLLIEARKLKAEGGLSAANKLGELSRDLNKITAIVEHGLGTIDGFEAMAKIYVESKESGE